MDLQIIFTIRLIIHVRGGSIAPVIYTKEFSTIKHKQYLLATKLKSNTKETYILISFLRLN